ncbi:esterase-lipase [Diplocarpon rosae]|nr:esterase-lipase [Diplocarpon rosae]
MPPRISSLRLWALQSAFSRATHPGRTYTSKTKPLTLSYDLHSPPKPSSTNPRAIIFMHGLFGSKKNNRSISKALARDLGRPIYAVDLRNHGDSPHDPHHDYLSMAADVAGFMTEHDLEVPTLIGHSMGAKTAMTLALRSPELIHDLVSVDNAPVDVALQSNFAEYIRGMKKIEEARVTRQAEADEVLRTYEESLPVRQFLLGNLYTPPSTSYKQFKVPLHILGSALGNLGDFPFKDPGAVRFEGPALFVRGTRSKYVSDEALPAIGEFFPRFRLADVDCGHWVISEKPEEFRQAVLEFLTPTE